MTARLHVKDATTCTRCGSSRIRGRACLHCGFDPEHGARLLQNFKIPDLEKLGDGDQHA